MLTLDKFEEASRIVGEVTLETKLVYSDFLSERQETRCISSRRICSLPAPIKCGGPTTRLVRFLRGAGERLITASAGNHAQGVAYAAKVFRGKGDHRHADHDTADQGQPH